MGERLLALLALALSLARPACCVTDKDRWAYDDSPSRIDSRVSLNCREFQSGEESKDLKMCSELTRSIFMGDMRWTGVHAALQGRQLLRVGSLPAAWRTEYNVQDKQRCLGRSHDRYCRGLYHCTMTERLFGWLIGAPGFLGAEPQPLGLDNVRDGPDDQVVKCKQCLYEPCGFYGCAQGRVNAVALETTAGQVIRLPECGVACSPGTFLTCKTAQECAYLPPTDAEQRGGVSGARAWYRANVGTYKVDANLVSVDLAAPPVGRCYACRHAAFLTHYMAVSSTDDSLLDRGYLRFRCPGGSDAPVRCGANEVVKFLLEGEASSECGCQPGFYLNGTLGRCALCPPGFYCDWHGLRAPSPVECPGDTYSGAGASACTPCDMSRRCDGGQALTRCRQSQGAEAKGVFQRENAACVDCNQCQQLQPSPPLSDAVPCYKVSPRVF